MARKLFVGSLPDGVPDDVVRQAFSAYGMIEEIYVKPNCPPGKQNAFVTFATPEEAQYAKDHTDRTLSLPGSPRACEVMIARNQGTHGQQVEVNARFAPAGPAPGGFSGPRASAGVIGSTGAPSHVQQPSRAAYPVAVSNRSGYGASGQRKIHVGSLPDNIQEWQLQEEFARFGTILEIYLKQGCESGRQWAFITYGNAQEAALAKETCDRQLTFPSSLQPVEVVFARNQDSPAQGGESFPPMAQSYGRVTPPMPARPVATGASGDGPRKILVGSLPDGIQEGAVHQAFSCYGTITDIYVKPNCDPGRQWAFVTFTSGFEAQEAKANTDRILMLPGAVKAAEVMFARQSAQDQQGGGQQMMMVAQPAPTYVAQPAANNGGAPNKIFVGSMTGNVTEQALRTEFERFGRISDVYIKPEGTCEPGRQWGFVTFSTADEANAAKESTDRLLFFPGAERPCEVMIARNRGPGGGAPAPAAAAPAPMRHSAYAQPASPHQPPPPNTPPPFDKKSTPWREYFTNEGLPYYNNSATGQTVWERPFDLPPLYGGQPARGQAPAYRRSPY